MLATAPVCARQVRCSVARSVGMRVFGTLPGRSAVELKRGVSGLLGGFALALQGEPLQGEPLQGELTVQPAALLHQLQPHVRH